ncbi:MAG: methylmalonyl Co-A mutase-associated GTPase MeaB [Deltaproteobacteria bacterium]|nr:methylmalonyl Co-A mutase-associated GTPase MeaB [Deltaproteobacteria bacterium]
MAKRREENPNQSGGIRALARLLTQIENRDPAALVELSQLESATDTAYRLGVTGPPGSGKSTLVDQLIRRLREQGERVAVVAVDPSSPFSGGAVLGDRVRMQAHAADDGVFIRSLGSRGAHGGLSAATRAMTRALAAHGFRWIIIETVGVGQTECDIMELADTTLVVLVPEAGDVVQTLKAGLLEVADLFVVNKGDRPGATQMANALTAMVELGRFESGTKTLQHDAAHHITETATTPESSTAARWRVPVLQTTATTGDGAAELLTAIRRHAAWVGQDAAHDARQRAVRRRELLDLCAEAWRVRFDAQLAASAELRQLVEAVERGELNPYAVVASLCEATMASAGAATSSLPLGRETE